MIWSVLCRLTGRGCSRRHPSTGDLIREMRGKARSAEAEAVEIRRRRLAPAGPIESAMRGDPRRETERS